ncbi:bcl-2-like protein 13 isoform X1 [Clupea harengus]|uniref:Bcl-2-like protein 13 isoform X1 n=2 Tax=Clupea harengus TaxID=7950 RepID=A0A8M1KGI8_CLUHA|nr:bcl-2-like protein 13 isoform X1 [Clupea harengus]
MVLNRGKCASASEIARSDIRDIPVQQLGFLLSLEGEAQGAPSFTMEGQSAATPSGEGQLGQLSKTTVPLSPEEVSYPSSWQTDSLASSWATVGTLDPEDAKSLEANEALLLAEERSENHSSTSDIVHLEREEAELLEEAERQAEARSLRDVEVAEEVEELQSSMMSVLGTERELAELRVEQCLDVSGLKAPNTMELLMSVEEPELQDEPEEVLWPLLSSTPPPAIPEPPVLAPLPVPAPPVLVDPEFQPLIEVPPSLPRLEEQPPRKAHKESQEEVKESRKELPIPSFSLAPPVEVQKDPLAEPALAPLAVEESFDAKEVPVTQEPEPTVPPSSGFELSTLFYGSAALVAVMGMVAYGALALSRK